MAPTTIPAATERLRFRAYRLTDVEMVKEMFADEEAQRWYPTKSQRDESMQWIEWNLRNYEEHAVGLWVIENRSSGMFLGDCGLTIQTVEDDELLEVGYHLQKRYRGNGFAVESARACAQLALGEMRVQTVCSIVDPRNEPSMRVAEAVHDFMRTFVNDEGNLRNLYWTGNSSSNTPPYSTPAL